MGRATGRRGSKESDKQIFRAVRDERVVTFHLGDSPIQGWILGVDDYHWVVVNKDQDVYLVHKSCPVVRISSDTLSEVADEGDIPSLRRKLEPFRNLILAEHFGHQPRSAAS